MWASRTIWALAILAGTAAPAWAEGVPAPTFSLGGYDDKAYDLGALKGKRGAVLVFWASW